MDINGFRMSRHALERALEMQLDGEKIRLCLTQPHCTEPDRREPGTTFYYRGDITCVVVDETNTVKTVLWRTDKAWRKDLKNRPCEGREYRGTA